MCLSINILCAQPLVISEQIHTGAFTDNKILGKKSAYNWIVPPLYIRRLFRVSVCGSVPNMGCFAATSIWQNVDTTQQNIFKKLPRIIYSQHERSEQYIIFGRNDTHFIFTLFRCWAYVMCLLAVPFNSYLTFIIIYRLYLCSYSIDRAKKNFLSSE